jgi:hypothetical protein
VWERKKLSLSTNITSFFMFLCHCLDNCLMVACSKFCPLFFFSFLNFPHSLSQVYSSCFKFCFNPTSRWTKFTLTRWTSSST